MLFRTEVVFDGVHTDIINTMFQKGTPPSAYKSCRALSSGDNLLTGVAFSTRRPCAIADRVARGAQNTAQNSVVPFHNLDSV